jgi:hypothetical protein
MVSPSRLRVSNTTTNTHTLPVTNPTLFHRANHKVLTTSLHHHNNKLSALSFGHPSIHIHPPTTKVNLRDLLLIIRAHFAQQIHNNRSTIPITDTYQFCHNAHPTIAHRFDLHLTQTNAHPCMDPPTSIRALHPTPPPLSATTVDA